MISREKLLEEGVHLENSLLKVPLENTVKFFRLTSKSLEKEIQLTVQLITTLASKKGLTKSDIAKGVKEELTKLKNLRTKFEDVKRMEREHLEIISSRIGHLKLPFTNTISIDTWYKIRLDRLLVDHLARNGYVKTASLIVSNSKLNTLTDIETFQSINKITTSLEKKQCALALKWCGVNRTKLAKLNSTLEFNLRIQEFVELVKKKKEKDAIAYAKKNFPQYAATNMQEIKRVMGSLAFRKVNFHPYKDLFGEDRWKLLIEQFKLDSYQLHSLPSGSLLEIHLRAGLTALKTERCFAEHTKNINCPVCQPLYSDLANNLPYSRRQHSTLVCKITGKFMNDDNPPMALPNGYVYSKEALEAMLKSTGEIICPQTKQKYTWGELRKVFIT